MSTPLSPPIEQQSVRDERIYPGAPFTLGPALVRADAGLRKPIRGTAPAAGGLDLLWALVILFAWVIFALVGSLVSLSMAKSSDGVAIGLLVGTMAPWIPMAGGPLVVSAFSGNGPVVDFGLSFRWRFLWWGLLYGGISIIVALVLGWLSTQLWGTFDSAASEVAKSASGNKIAYTGVLIAIAFGAPIVEELFFRGLIFGAFSKLRIFPIISVILTAVLFGAIHFEPKRLLLLGGIGVVLGCARWHTGSVFTSIIAHMINNLLGVTGLLIGSGLLVFH